MTDRTYRKRYEDIATELSILPQIYPTEISSINRWKMIHITGLRMLSTEQQFEEAVGFFDDALTRMYDSHCRRPLPDVGPE